MSTKLWLASIAFATPLLAQTMTTLSGNVTYRVRMALPSTAVVKVTLQDVSLADAPAKVLGTATIPVQGKQVPIPFKLEYDKSQIIENHTYSVAARIEDENGKLLFISDTHNGVITRGEPSDNVTVMTRPAGGSTPQSGAMAVSVPPTPPSLSGTKWRLESLNGKPFAAGVETTIEFGPNGQVFGKGGCNQYRGSGSFSGAEALKVGPVASTLMACVNTQMSEQESAFYKALNQVTGWKRDGDTLLLNVAGSHDPIRFRRVTNVSLEGAWLLEDLNGKGVLDRLQSTVEFLPDGRLTGMGGCNRFNGKGQVNANNTLAVGPFMATRKACPPAVMNQETGFLQALEKATSWKLDGSVLYLECEGYDKPLKFSRMTK